MNRPYITHGVLLTAALATLCGLATGQDSTPLDVQQQAMAGIAANNPDHFAWLLFTHTFAPLPDAPGKVTWERWANSDAMFEDPFKTPEWPNEPISRSLKYSALLDHLNREGLFPDGVPANTGNYQEVRFNRPLFDYIVKNDLWYQEGIYRHTAIQPIDFPRDSKVIKVEWTPIKPEDKSRYYWTVYKTSSAQSGDSTASADEILLGVNAFHIVSKDLPRWAWTTFEHMDNPGLGDYIGIKDSWGREPHYTPPHREVGLKYETGKATPELMELFKKKNIGDVWKNYVLKGTQVDFTDATGQPTFMASSVLELRFGYASSCITCHAMATLGPPGIGNVPTNGNGQKLNFVLSQDPFVAPVGVPNPAWFTQQPVAGPLVRAPIVRQTDFLWSLPNSKSRKTTRHPQSNESSGQ
ncbi:MAG: hypothetical protein KDA66_04790 [Planctomycetaceae bacterium]|nr:hypothetical protein [Planctomycetaceae bacterium]